MLISSFLQSFRGGPVQEFSCELNREFQLMAHYLGGRIPRDGPSRII